MLTFLAKHHIWSFRGFCWRWKTLVPCNRPTYLVVSLLTYLSKNTERCQDRSRRQRERLFAETNLKDNICDELGKQIGILNSFCNDQSLFLHSFERDFLQCKTKMKLRNWGEGESAQPRTIPNRGEAKNFSRGDSRFFSHAFSIFERGPKIFPYKFQSRVGAPDPLGPPWLYPDS